MKKPTFGAFATEAEHLEWKTRHERALAEHAAAMREKYGEPDGARLTASDKDLSLMSIRP